MIRVIEVNELDAVARRADDWNRLLAQTPAATFFHTFEWLETYWRHRGAGQRLRVLFVETVDGETLGVVPLVSRRDQRRLGSVRVLTYPLDDWGSYHGPLGPAPAAALEAAARHVLAAPRDWNVLSLRWLGAAPGDVEAARGALAAAGRHGQTRVRERTSLVDFAEEQSWEAYRARRGTKWRNNTSRAERRLAERGAVEFARFRPRGAAHGEGDPRWELFETCVDLARRGWQGASRTGVTLSHACVYPLLKDLHAAAARLGAVDIALLNIDGRPLAFGYNYHWNGAVYGLRAGYDASAGLDGLGHTLLARCVQDGFARGDQLFDLGAGSADCKRHFRTRLQDIWQLDYYPPLDPRAQLVRLKQAWNAWRAARAGDKSH